MTPGRLTGKVAMITGSDSGIPRLAVFGQARAIEFAREGAAVFLASSDADYATGSTCVMDGGLMQNLGQGA